MRPPFSHDRTDQFIKKGTWSPQEDELLVAYIRRYGIWNWTEMPKAAGLMRSGKSCRLRWMNYLRPDIRRGNYSKEEEDTILKLHAKLGNKWSTIAASLSGRTDNDIKNHWHTHLKKRIKKHEELQTNEPMQGMDTIKQYDNSPQKEQVPALPTAIPVASDPGPSCLTYGFTSSSSVSWVPPRGLWDDQVNDFSMESFFLLEDTSWSAYTDYDLWFEESAAYSYSSDEELVRDFWDDFSCTERCMN